MKGEMKYIMIDGSFPVIFPDTVIHRDVAEGHLERVTSAGFVVIRFSPGEGVMVKTYGVSKSLGNIVPEPGDEEIIKKFLELGT